MADDTRQPDTSPADEKPQSDARPFTRPKPKHDFPKTQAGKMWEMLGNPAEPANALPGGTYNSAGGLSSMLITTNLAVTGFALSASGMYYWCDQRRREEARGMAMAVQGMKMLHEKKAREKAAEEAARVATAAAADIEEQERKRRAHWYKFW
ncbi:hypothetical protein AYO21_06328 [Fonsecaea monophora]|uniref:Cytochrome c oxidase assembly protein COX20, mitochondrial n=1 Tax=Fonsecaea monophora TaxID=254056 RepID=A0A177F7D6_9EURO|nr:hypothetical protein AYO21_06328 [Fonsecaea monophora]OAG39500.1 hypothetical protein AYO21_06328 [Fonsecaea monophora]